MGLLLVLLALAVVFEHSGGITGYRLIDGSLAVECFFIISGFYMGLVLNERYDAPALNRAFFASRAIRVFSLYFLFLGAYLAVFALVQLQDGASPLWPYLKPSLPLAEKAFLGLLNVTLVGQDLPLWLRIDHGHLQWTLHIHPSSGFDVFHFMLIPAAWSLSLELLFYAMAPFVARRRTWQVAALMLASLAARAGSQLLGFSADALFYRFFPFELALFLAGVLAYRLWAAHRPVWETPLAKVLALSVPLSMLAYAPLTGTGPSETFFMVPRVALLVLVVLGLPAIHGWTRHLRWDRSIGELSYPVYLNHQLVMGIIASMPLLAGYPTMRTLAVALVSAAFAFVVVRFADRRIEAWRGALASRSGAKAVHA